MTKGEACTVVIVTEVVPPLLEYDDRPVGRSGITDVELKSKALGDTLRQEYRELAATAGGAQQHAVLPFDKLNVAA